MEIALIFLNMMDAVHHLLEWLIHCETCPECLGSYLQVIMQCLTGLTHLDKIEPCVALKPK